MDKQAATRIVRAVREISRATDELTRETLRLDEDQAKWIRQGLAPVLINCDDILRRVVREFPDLDRESQI